MPEDIDALILKIKNIRQSIINDSVMIAKEMALTHKAVVVRRIQSEGIPGKRYSDNGVPLFFIEESGYARLNSGFDRLIKDKKKSKQNVSWKDVRYYQGLQTAFVDYTFSGRTFKNLTIVDTRVGGGGVAVADLGGSDQESKDKLSYGFKRYGRFLDPNQTEKENLQKVVEKKMAEMINKYKLV